MSSTPAAKETQYAGDGIQIWWQSSDLAVINAATTAFASSGTSLAGTLTGISSQPNPPTAASSALTNTPPPTNSETGLRPNAKIGIGVGVSILVILSMAVSFLVFRRRRKSKDIQNNEIMPSAPAELIQPITIHELYEPPFELASSRHYHEMLDTSVLAELASDTTPNHIP